MAYPTVFFPGTRSLAEATPIAIEAGDRQANVNLFLEAEASRQVSGIAMDPDGRPLGNLGLRLIRTDCAVVTEVSGLETAVTVTDRDGTFAFVGVPTGAYVLTGSRPIDESAGTKNEIAVKTLLEVGDSDVLGLVVSGMLGTTIEGQVRVAGSDSAPPRGISIALASIEDGTWRRLPAAAVDENGYFRFSGYLPGRYALSLGLPDGFGITSVRSNGIELANYPVVEITAGALRLETTIERVRGGVRGVVQGADEGTTVVVFPRDLEEWIRGGAPPSYVRTARVGVGGSYFIDGLPTNLFSVVAVPGQVVSTLTPALLRALATLPSEALQISDGLQANRNLSMSPGPTKDRAAGLRLADWNDDLMQRPPILSRSPIEFGRPTAAPRPVASSGPSSSVRGTVVAPSGKPWPQLLLWFSRRDGGAERVAVTDSAGQFSIDGLPSGQYRVAILRPGFLLRTGSSVTSDGPDRYMTLEPATTLDVQMCGYPGGSLEGAVTDDSGRGRPFVTMALFKARTAAAQQVPELVRTQRVTTDEKGRYRFSGLAEGRYLVAAAPSTYLTDDLRYELTFYPGSPQVTNAAVIEIRPGETTRGIDIGLKLVRAGGLRGTVVLPDGVGATTVTASLVRSPDLGITSGAWAGPFAVRLDSDGRFSLNSVSPGSYELVATGRGDSRSTVSDSGPMTLWANTRVTVEAGNTTTTRVVLKPAATIAGSVVANGRSSSTPPAFLIELSPLPGQAGRRKLTSTAIVGGRFELRNVIPGQYRLRVVASEDNGWIATRAATETRQVLDQIVEVQADREWDPILVTVAQAAATVSGTVSTTPFGRPGDYVVVLLSTARSHWNSLSSRTRQLRPNADGTFHFGQLPAGSYCLVLLARELTDNERDDSAVFDAVVQQGVAVQLAAGSTVYQNLAIVR